MLLFFHSALVVYPPTFLCIYCEKLEAMVLVSHYKVLNKFKEFHYRLVMPFSL